MQCPKCQFENPQGIKFCGECGAKLEKLCPSCNSSSPPNFKFCGECGHKLDVSAETSPNNLSFDEKLTKIQKYLPKGLTEKILSQRDRIEGERKHVTVLFCDMVGFTALSEKLGPDDAYAIMDKIYEILIHKVHDYDGTVNEMTGDGIMALFGAPIAMEDAPQRAIRSGMSIHQEVEKFNDRVKKENTHIPKLKMRIGIHTGPVVVGTLGNDLRVEFKAVGDTVNTASRMEELAEPGTIFVTEDTFQLSEGLFQFEALGEKKIKGKESPVRIYRVLSSSSRRTRFDVNAGRGLTPFIGRERELELLIDGFERTKDGRGQALSIIGEAGLGKSRLLYEFRKSVTNEDLTFLEGKCLSFSSNVAYHPVIDILKTNFLINESDNDTDIAEKVKSGLITLEVDETSTLPYLLELLSVRQINIEKQTPSPEIIKDRIIEALNRILIKGSERKPVILAIEDLHWVDKSSEETLKYLLDAISGERIFVIFTYRPEFVHSWGGKSYHSQVNLNQLSNRQSLAMASNLLGTRDIDQTLEELILEKTEGVPFFIEEFIKSLMSLGIIEKKDNTINLISDLNALTIPATIQDVIMARIDKLPEGAKEVLQTGSVIEREFSFDLIKAVTDLPEQRLLSHLSALKDFELLYERGIYPQSAYVFKHALTQEVAYNSLLKKRRKEVHSKVAGTIELIYSARLDEFYEKLADHYSRADESKKAHHYLKLSGNKSMRSHSNWEAFHFYKEANLVLIKEDETEENLKRRFEILQLMIGPMRILGYPEDSAQLLEEGEKLLSQVGEVKDLTHIYSTIGHYNITKGDSFRGLEYAEKSYQEAVKTSDTNLIIKTGWYYCSALYVTGRFVKLIELAQEVLDLLKNTKNENESFGLGVNLYSGLLGFKGCTMGWLGNFQEGELLLDRGLKFASGIDDKTCLGLIDWFYGMFFLVKGNWKSAIEHLQKSVKHLEERRFYMILGSAWMKLGLGYYCLKDLAKAKQCTEKGLTIHNDTGLNYWLSLSTLTLGLIDFDQGESKGVQKYLKEAIEIAQNSNEKHIEGISKIWLGRMLGRIKPSQIDKAEEFILKGIEINKKLKIKPEYAIGYLFLGELYLNTVGKEKAIKNLKRSEKMFQEMGMDYWLTQTREVFSRL